MKDHEYLTIMLAKLVDALIRKGTEHDGNWGYPSFEEELREMQASLHDTEAVKKAGRAALEGEERT